MTLPTSGPLSFSAINTELGRSSTAQMSLQTAETGGYVAINQASPSKPNGLAPYAVSEWYGYDQNAASAGTITLDFYNYGAFATARVLINGVINLQLSNTGSQSASIQTGFSFQGAVNTGSENYVQIYIDSSTRGTIYAGDGFGTSVSDVFTRQAGENITVSIYVTPFGF